MDTTLASINTTINAFKSLVEPIVIAVGAPKKSSDDENENGNGNRTSTNNTNTNAGDAKGTTASAATVEPQEFRKLLTTLDGLFKELTPISMKQILESTDIAKIIRICSKYEPLAAESKEQCRILIDSWRERLRTAMMPVSSVTTVQKTQTQITTTVKSNESTVVSKQVASVTSKSTKAADNTSTTSASQETSPSSPSSSAASRSSRKRNSTSANDQSSDATLKRPKQSSPSPSSPSVPEPTSKQQESKRSKNSSANSAADTNIALGQTGDSTRDKIQELLFTSLCAATKQNDNQSSQNYLERSYAVQLESAMFECFGDTGANYKQKYRELAMNIKDPNNPDLIHGLMSGELPPEQIIRMSHKDLASAQLKAKRAKEAAWARDEARSDMEKDKGVTDMFLCGKCRERKCTYYQMQTRSADEPMTVFVRCLNCGNRWKM